MWDGDLIGPLLISHIRPKERTCYSVFFSSIPAVEHIIPNILETFDVTKSELEHIKKNLGSRSESDLCDSNALPSQIDALCDSNALPFQIDALHDSNSLPSQIDALCDSNALPSQIDALCDSNALPQIDALRDSNALPFQVDTQRVLPTTFFTNMLASIVDDVILVEDLITKKEGLLNNFFQGSLQNGASFNAPERTAFSKNANPSRSQIPQVYDAKLSRWVAEADMFRSEQIEVVNHVCDKGLHWTIPEEVENFTPEEVKVENSTPEEVKIENFVQVNIGEYAYELPQLSEEQWRGLDWGLSDDEENVIEDFRTNAFTKGYDESVFEESEKNTVNVCFKMLVDRESSPSENLGQSTQESITNLPDPIQADSFNLLLTNSENDIQHTTDTSSHSEKDVQHTTDNSSHSENDVQHATDNSSHSENDIQPTTLQNECTSGITHHQLTTLQGDRTTDTDLPDIQLTNLQNECTTGTSSHSEVDLQLTKSATITRRSKRAVVQPTEDTQVIQRKDAQQTTPKSRGRGRKPKSTRARKTNGLSSTPKKGKLPEEAFFSLHLTNVQPRTASSCLVETFTVGVSNTRCSAFLDPVTRKIVSITIPKQLIPISGYTFSIINDRSSVEWEAYADCLIINFVGIESLEKVCSYGILGEIAVFDMIDEKVVRIEVINASFELHDFETTKVYLETLV